MSYLKSGWPERYAFLLFFITTSVDILDTSGVTKGCFSKPQLLSAPPWTTYCASVIQMDYKNGLPLIAQWDGGSRTLVSFAVTEDTFFSCIYIFLY